MNEIHLNDIVTKDCFIKDSVTKDHRLSYTGISDNHEKAQHKTEAGHCRKGIMGGTFDPIHNGHLTLAQCALQQFQLDEILFLPAGNPPHKQGRTDGAAAAARLAMVRLAISGYPYFLLDDEEMYRYGLSYTRDTLIRLNEKEPDTEFFFIIGADSLMTFDTWYQPNIICKYCSLLVAPRDGADADMINHKMEQLRLDYNASVFLLDSPQVEVSSTDIRHLCEENRSIRGLVPDAVADYIKTHDLYSRTFVAESCEK
ncbi:MAG: nicotinate-nucleotide adenylyltransferase [Lachnospiraceae bacterium]|nr:nicotinate-nucleotide adenylyltransferase [Lachnospiraceae bacterium]